MFRIQCSYIPRYYLLYDKADQSPLFPKGNSLVTIM